MGSHANVLLRFFASGPALALLLFAISGVPLSTAQKADVTNSSSAEWQLAVVVALTSDSGLLLRCLLNETECPRAGVAEDPLGPLLAYLDRSPSEQQGRTSPLNTLFHLPNSGIPKWLRNSTALSGERQRAFDDIARNTLDPCGFGERCGDQTAYNLVRRVALFNYFHNPGGDSTPGQSNRLSVALVTDQIDQAFLNFEGEMRFYNLEVTFYIPQGAETVANYYYFTLGRLVGVQMLLPNSGNTSPLIGVPFVSEPQNVTDLMNTHWHLIYVVALSDNVSPSQFEAVKRSMSEPVEAYRKTHPSDTVEVWTLFPTLMNLMAYGNREKVCKIVIEDRAAEFGDYLAANVSWTQNLLQNVIGVYPWFSIGALDAAWRCYSRQLGARLSQKLDQDADLISGNAYVQKRPPHIYFITDYVEERLVNVEKSRVVPDRMAKLHIYALNERTRQKYADRYREAASVFEYSFENGTQICIEEPISPPSTPPAQVGVPLYAIVAAVVSTVLIVALGATALVYRRNLRWLEKVNWLHADHQRTSRAPQHAKKPTEAEDDPLALSWHRLALKELIGDGAFGQVYRAYLFVVPERNKSVDSNVDFANGTQQAVEPIEVAVKVIPSYAGDTSKRDFAREIKLMKSLPHCEHLVRLIGCISGGPRPCLVLEYCARGTLLAHVRQLAQAPPPDKQFAMFCWQICAGVHFLHSLHLLHRDLAARNVLIDAHNKIKICDFGLCERFEPHQTAAEPSNRVADFAQGIGPLVAWQECDQGMGGGRRRFAVKWLAPECLRRRQFSPKSDIWSLGVVLFEMHSFGAVPFGDIAPEQMLSHLEQGNRLPRPQRCPDQMWEIMGQCWAEAPEQRPDSDALLPKFASILEGMTEQYGYLDLAREEREAEKETNDHSTD